MSEHQVKILCDCGELHALPEGWFDAGVAFHFWKHHGHFPNTIWFKCSCGAEQPSGPAGGLRGYEQGQLDEEFIRVHGETGAFHDQTAS